MPASQETRDRLARRLGFKDDLERRKFKRAAKKAPKSVKFNPVVMARPIRSIPDIQHDFDLGERMIAEMAEEMQERAAVNAAFVAETDQILGAKWALKDSSVINYSYFE